MKLREYIKENKLITDGSFGTYFADRYSTEEMPELANLTHGEWVEEIHKAYIEVGARLIRTNTFAANTVLLKADMLAVREYIKAAVSHAKGEGIEKKEDNFAAEVASMMNN